MNLIELFTMSYKIISDRFEIEKMAERLYAAKLLMEGKTYTQVIAETEILVHIDYVDLRTLKRHGTFKHAIICDVELGNEAWTNEFINVIQS